MCWTYTFYSYVNNQLVHLVKCQDYGDSTKRDNWEDERKGLFFRWEHESNGDVENGMSQVDLDGRLLNDWKDIEMCDLKE